MQSIIANQININIMSHSIKWIFSLECLSSFSMESLLILRKEVRAAPVLTEEERDEFYRSQGYLPEELGDGFPDAHLKLQALTNIRKVIKIRLLT